MLRLGLFLLAILAAAPAAARESYVDPGIPSVRAAALPGEARQTLALIKQGGPFPYRKDGSVFGNFERRLPARPRGYYREYTVPTTGSRDRGARRIVAGRGSTGDVRTSGEYYFTNDHYRSFRKIRE
ncbi:MAG: ribonuclease [Rhodocyclales bacterium]|jgi:ribonuclease T1|nr:ribonuclease [Rhodocyclaceae bacterium]PWB40049.1 MAG: ribonuclease [Rhodocyclales bacterium]